MAATEEEATMAPHGVEAGTGSASARPLPQRLRQTLTGIAVFAVSLLTGLVVSFAYERAQFSKTTLPRVLAAGQHVGGLNERELDATFSRLGRQLSLHPVVLSLQGQELPQNAAELGVALDVEAASERALQTGRRGSMFSQFGFWLVRLVEVQAIALPLEIDREILRARVRPWARKRLPEPVKAKIIYDGKLRARFSEPGTVVAYDALEESLRDELKSISRAGHQSVRLELPVTHLEAKISRQQVKARLAQAQQLLSGPIHISAPDGQSTTLDPSSLGHALESKIEGTPPRLTLDLWPERLRHELADFIEGVEVPARDATYEVEGSGELSLVPSQEGLVVDEQELVDDVFSAAENDRRKVVLSLVTQKPALPTEEAEKLGIKRLVSSFTTRHPCCRPRVHNIHAVADQVDGVVLRPGQRFSLNEFLGPREGSPLYKKAPTIVHGEMKETAGGGISQFATTLFNAVLDGGYSIVQRQPHSYYFPRYPEGHEATVSYPEPDLVFENDTDAGLLLKTRYDKTFIKVLLYGDNGGRRVRRTKSRRFDITQPPTEHEPDPEMSPQGARRLRAGQIGWSVLVSRIIDYPDGRHVEQERKVVYKPRPRLVRVHPCNIPKGQPGYTSTPCPKPEGSEEEDIPAEEMDFVDDSIPDDERVDWEGAP